MIFLTVGTQLPFDRLVVAFDRWAESHGHHRIFGQIGPTSYRPQYFPFTDFLSPKQIDEYFRRSDLIVSHAGMGTVLSALHYQKPLIIVPRRSDLREHRNDHQLATARWLENEFGICVAFEMAELEGLLCNPVAVVSPRIGEFAPPELIKRLRDYVFAD